jgi:glycosyltransferase involved in cell wall biosynthesis
VKKCFQNEALMKFSVIIPANNEEYFIGKCLSSIDNAKKMTNHAVEVIVCLNRCTDRTEEVARKSGALIVKEDAKNLSIIRNAGAKIASGDVIVTIDADSRMSKNTFNEIERLLSSGKFIGGGTRIKLERWSLGIIMSMLVITLVVLKQELFSVSAGLFWCHRRDFDTIGGFNESLNTVEDLDFAKRLKQHGKTVGKKYGTLWKAYIITSCRKFDQFGDWYFFLHPKITKNLYTGKNKALADKFYYKIER